MQNLERLSCPGMMRENSCLPVQSGNGLRMAGVGILPSQEGRNISRFIICSLSMKTSLLVIFLTAVRVSCTIPITGLFDCGEITCKKKSSLAMRKRSKEQARMEQRSKEQKEHRRKGAVH